MGAAGRADRRHARGVLADTAKRQAEGGMDDSSRYYKTYEKHGERVDVGGPAIEVEAEPQHRGHAEPLQAVCAAGERARAVRRLVQQKAEAEGEHDEREVPEAHHDVAQHVTENSRKNTRYQQTS